MKTALTAYLVLSGVAAAFLIYFNVHWIDVVTSVATFGILPAAAGAVAGYALAVRLRLVTRGELADLARQIFPSNLYVRVAPVASKVLDVLD